jgi:hypothetical protein
MQPVHGHFHKIVLKSLVLTNGIEAVDALLVASVLPVLCFFYKRVGNTLFLSSGSQSVWFRLSALWKMASAILQMLERL